LISIHYLVLTVVIKCSHLVFLQEKHRLWLLLALLLKKKSKGCFYLINVGWRILSSSSYTAEGPLQRRIPQTSSFQKSGFDICPSKDFCVNVSFSGLCKEIWLTLI
jgi:hypothetical protein